MPDEKEFVKPTEQLCWSCLNCTNSTEHHCPWSEYGEPVPGWDAQPSSTGRSPSYSVRSCPMYERDPMYYNSTNAAEVSAVIEKEMPEFAKYYIIGNKAALETVLCEYRGLQHEYCEEWNKKHCKRIERQDISDDINGKLKILALKAVYKDQEYDESGKPKLLSEATYIRGLKMIRRAHSAQ